MQILAESTAGSGAIALGGLMMFVLGLLSMALAILWLIFPFMVDHHFRKMRHSQDVTNYYLRRIAEEAAQANARAQTNAIIPPPPPPLPVARESGGHEAIKI